MTPAQAQLRRGITTLTHGLTTDLGVLWRHADTPDKVTAALHDVLPALIERYGIAAAALAAHWYDALREHHEVKGSFTAVPADIPDSGANALVGWAADTAKDYAAFQSLVTGGAQRRVANFSRQTVMGSSYADPQAAGWQRVGSGECSFCSLLISRGLVYSEASADFASHDNCSCGCEPVFGGESRPVKPYTPTDRNITDADRARTRAYIASH